MTKTELIAYINQPEKIGEAETLKLAEWSARYPWCQSLHVLQTKGLHNTRSIGYLESLKYSAALSSDRKVLYTFIMQQDLIDKINAILEEENTETPVENRVEIVEEKSKETPKENSAEEKQQVLVTRDLIEELVDQKVKARLEDLDQQDEVGKEKQEAIQLPKTETLIEQIPEEKISEKYSEIEKQILWEAVNASIQVDAGDEEERKPEIKIQTKVQQPNETFDWDSKHSFFRWLLPNTNETEESAESTKKPGKLEIDDLVEKFIQTAPRISPQKAEFYSPGNMAKLSITDNEEFVSETLAKIYEKQNYFQKAVRVYEKLSLKIPEKSTYFAARIKELESLMKNTKK